MLIPHAFVQLGDFFVSTRFGCVTKSKGHDWAEADGILGVRHAPPHLLPRLPLARCGRSAPPATGAGLSLSPTL